MGNEKPSEKRLSQLSEREVEVLRLLAEGAPLSGKLHISEESTRKAVESILATLPPLPTWDVQLEGTISVRIHASTKASAVRAAREIITTANDAGGRVEQAQLTARAAKKVQPIESE
jgi:hypothetical protein